MRRTEYEDIKANLIKKSLEREKTDVYVPVERRKGDDIRLTMIKLTSFLSWGIVVIVLSIIITAGKSVSYIYYNNLIEKSLEYWNVNLLKIAFILILINTIICLIFIFLNFTRYRRRSDRIKKSLIICDIISGIILVFLVVKLIMG